MTTWYTEKHTPHSGITLEIKKNIYQGKSEYQTLQIVETFDFGRMLLLDGLVMLTERDEFVYHEMIAHVPLNTHPFPEKVLVIGGGDGGTVREVLKHSEVREVTLVEIDPMVVDASLEYLPTLSEGLRDPRTEIIYGDGVQFVADSLPETYDIILVDSTDPIGPAKALFTEDFFLNCEEALNPDGLFVSQSESPFHHLPFMVEIHRRIQGVYPAAAFYLAPVPTYPSGSWSFLMGSKAEQPPLPYCRDHVELLTKYYDRHVHLASFTLPRFLAEALGL
jgi:spermidine synthase